MKVGAATHAGVVRKINQDSMFVDEHIGLFMVADGLGGHSAGELASLLAVEQISRHIESGVSRRQDAEQLLTQSVLAAHQAILTASTKNPEWADMGTTVVIAMMNGDHFLICHVGDSRAYAVGNGSIQSLTRDHSLVSEWLEEGRISETEARTHRARHGLTMALGVDDDVTPSISCVTWLEETCLLLCSDGLTDMLDEPQILRIIRDSNDPQTACGNLVSAANEKGGQDNITVILICP